MKPAAHDPLSPRRATNPSAVRAAILLAVLAGTDEVRAASLPPLAGIRVIPAVDVLRDHTRRTESGDLLFVDAAGSPVRLVTAADDPLIANRGDGAFHPAETADALAALTEIDMAFTAPLRVDVFLLPFPRAGTLSSSSDSLAVYLSPGTEREAVRRTLPATLAHEIGHAVQHRVLPHGDADGWAQYRRIRGLTDTTLFRSDAPHADRPVEIFAEDFRVLFGGARARGNGAIENPRILPPESVPGLAAFFQARLDARRGADGPLLASNDVPVPEGRLFPNPARPGSSITLALSPADDARSAGDEPDAPEDVYVVSLYDAAGRCVHAARAGTVAGRLRLRLPDDVRPGSRVLWLRACPADGGGPAVTASLRLLR